MCGCVGGGSQREGERQMVATESQELAIPRSGAGWEPCKRIFVKHKMFTCHTVKFCWLLVA